MFPTYYIIITKVKKFINYRYGTPGDIFPELLKPGKIIS